MRRLMLALIGAILILSVNVYGVEMNLIYDEIYHYYNVDDVFIEINGQRVETREMPPVILQDRTLVPVREVFESVGATVSWINETSQTSISYRGTEVLFTTGSRAVYTNSSMITIPITDPAPMIINDKTMVPVRIVANLLGLNVSWDDARRTVVLSDAVQGSSSSSLDGENIGQASDNSVPPADTTTPTVVYDNIISKIHCMEYRGADLIYLAYGNPAQPEISRYSNPNRVVMDFYGAQLLLSTSSIGHNGAVVTSVRCANHDNMARLVLDVTTQPDIEIYKTATGIVIVASPISGSKYTTKTGDLVNGPEFDPEQMTDRTGNGGYQQGFGNNGETVDLDTSGTVDTTNTRSFDYNSIVIDPGHGGSDPGAMAGGARESAINLAIAEKVVAKLRAAGYNVIITRNNDNVKPSLQDRVDIASMPVDGNKIPAIFVSIHCNSFDNPETNGTQVYYHPDSKYGTILAQNIYNANISGTSLRAAQIHDGSHLYVIRKTLQPAALVETAFISNASDRDYLTSYAGQEALAQGIYEGIVKTMNTMKADKGI